MGNTSVYLCVGTLLPRILLPSVSRAGSAPVPGLARAHAGPLEGWPRGAFEAPLFKDRKRRTLFSFSEGLTLTRWCLLEPVSVCLSLRNKCVKSIIFLNVCLIILLEF